MQEDTRDLWFRRSKRFATVAAIAATGLVFAACGGDSDSDSGSAASGDTAASDGAATGGNFGSLKIAFTSSLDPNEVPGYRGPVINGKEFGLDQKLDDLKTFDSTNTALQVMLSGKLDVVGGAFLNFMQARAQQPDLRAFCPMKAGFPGSLVGINETDSIEKLADPKTKVVLESPGGPNNFFMDLVYEAKGQDFRTTTFKNVVILDDNPQRFAALLKEQASVAIVTAAQVKELKKGLGEDKVHVLSDIMADIGDDAIYLAFYASKDWLDKNIDAATALCASILKSNRDMAKDFELFKSNVAEYIDAEVPEADLKLEWDATRQYQLWPYNHGLTKSSVERVVNMAVETKLIKEAIPYEEIVDERPILGAQEKLGGEIDPSEITG
jgi:ABC-type nitrate/sulfonate/bicarbonate transport system substrate-binding protein